jgi:hypothetical protein
MKAFSPKVRENPAYALSTTVFVAPRSGRRLPRARFGRMKTPGIRGRSILFVIDHQPLKVQTMNSEAPSAKPQPDDAGETDKPGTRPFSYSYDDGGAAVTTHIYSYRFEEQPGPFNFDHDAKGGVFILTKPDGTEERFRDSPARHLLVEPDPQTGELRLVVKHGRPAYIWPCREERER